MKRYLWSLEIAMTRRGPWVKWIVYSTRSAARAAKGAPYSRYRRIVKYVSER